jgi:hypothetical protein
MAAKSFLHTMRAEVRHMYATSVRGEVSDATIQGYLRAASQIEETWQHIDERLAALRSQGVVPWEAYEQLSHALAFVRAARTYQVFVRELLAADAAADPGTAGYLPHITFDQANALCQQILPCLQQAIGALNDPSFTPGMALPLILGPRLEVEGKPCPTTHLQGMIAAAREVREWAAGLIAQYKLAINQGERATPADIAVHLVALEKRLAQADAELRFGTDLVGQVSQGEATAALHEEAEKHLWEALQAFFLLNQAVAHPAWLHQIPRGSRPSQKERSGQIYHDRTIRPDDLWQVASASARSELRGKRFGTKEMNELCEKMGGILSAAAQRYLDEVAAAVERDEAYACSSMANCPFEPLYRARRNLNIAGARIPAGFEFHWDFHRGHVESKARFHRSNEWEECEE